MSSADLTVNHDEDTNALLRLSTRQADAGDWDAAIATLYAARDRMVESWVHYPPETWCRLPLFLSRAGRFDEADAAFDWLLADAPRRARKESFMDDPNVFLGSSKKSAFNSIVRNVRRVVKEKRAVVLRRRQKAAATG